MHPNANQMKKFRLQLISFILPGNSGMLNLNISKPVRAVLKVTGVIILLLLIDACHSFYKVRTTPEAQSETLTSLKQLNKNFVFHSEFAALTLNNIIVGDDSIWGDYESVYTFPSTGHSFPAPNSSNRFVKKKGDGRLLNEVHLYTRQVQKNILPGITLYAAALNDIYRLDVYNFDQGRTILSWVMGAVGGYFAAGLTVMLIALLGLAISGDSCPYVYVNQGDQFGFAGEIYSGAVYASLERNDYLYLPGLVEENGNYLLKISNELDEVQHTNLAELLVIDHPENSRVLFDKYGNCQTADNIRPPISATSLSGADILQVVGNKDSICYSGIDPGIEIPLTGGVSLTFDLPPDVNSCKLFINARNSIWLDHVFHEFHGMLGAYQETWTKRQDKADPQNFINWALEQKIPLSVYVQNQGEWKFCDYFNLAGPMALKEDVLALDLKDVHERPLKIKLEAGTCFWEIDYVGMDYSTDFTPVITTVSVEHAFTEDQVNVTELLNRDDSAHYVQPETDNVALLSFPVPAARNVERTVILHSKGYYHINRESDGIPKVARLNKIRKPGQFSLYSRDLLKSELDKLKVQSALSFVQGSNGKK